MLSRIREALAVVLIAVLPFHALLVTVATKAVLGPGKAPWGALALWKEGLIAVLLGAALVEILRSRKAPRFDAVDSTALALGALLLAVSAFVGTPVSGILFGIKYDLLAPAAFLVLRRVEWSPAFRARALTALLVAGALAAAYGILSFFLPDAFFTALGYSDAHSLYRPDSPLAAFQKIAGSPIRRVQGPMSGPNQFGIWLLLPWSAAVAVQIRARRALVLPATAFALTSAAIFLTFSRSAWIGGFLILAAAVLPLFPRKIASQIVVASGALLALLFLILSLAAPRVILRVASSREHVVRPMQAIARMTENPLGMGLAAAGPASNRLKEPCVFLDPGSDPSWAKGSPELCVFVGDAQAQPAGRACDCPFLPESWYLQIGVEAGFLGLLLFLALTATVLLRAAASARLGALEHAAFLAFLGVACAALFLHAWEDSAVAYSTWLLAAVALSRQPARNT